ncbi:DUF1307 domain-containing protein [Enterococcus sp. LJL51]|uniref:DUF1307 domain-containing protein n=1 Tax=Enterococcus sp. LJL51 TaxID=3416656 RepID=UPI003CEE72CE
MKKVLRKGWLLPILLICLIATGCSTGGSTSKRKNSNLATTVFEMKQDGVEMEIIYTHNGDKVVKQETYSTIEYEPLNISSKEEAEEMFSFVKDEYDVKGITYKADYQEDKMVEKVVVDYEVADLKEVMTLMGTITDGSEEDRVVKYISMKQSKEMLLEQGYTEKK